MMETELEGFVVTGAGIAGLATALALHRPPPRTTSIQLQSFDLITLDGGGMIRNFSLQASDSGHKFRCVKRAALLEALATALPPETIKFNSRVLRVRQSLSSKYSSETEPEDGTNHPPEIIKFNSKFLGAAISELQIFVGNGAGRRNRNQSKGGDWLRWSEVGGSIGVSRVSDSRQCRALRGSGNGDLHRRSRCPTKSSDSLLQWSNLWAHSGQRQRTLLVRRKITPKLPKIPRESMNSLGLYYIIFLHKSQRRVTAAGDAVHPMTPDLAQGGCCALEDAIVLARCLAESLNGRNNTDNEGQIVEEALKTYVDERKWRWVWLVSQVYITGLVQQSSSDFLRFIRDKVVLKFMSPKDMFIQYLL
ncbi:hypothetical protein SUGI_1178200 [Cryptomeria japonica]|nr:hypothetical protein SUGI_1178200 [Cryptomeria japonica]